MARLWPSSLSTWSVVTAVVGLLAAWMDAGRVFHAWQGADSLIPVLVSLLRWTPFYWQQDRFGMLVPLLATPVRDPWANLLVQDWLMTSAALLAPFLIARAMARIPAVWCTAGATANLLLFLCVRADVRFDWLVTQPYALSIALGAAALIVVERSGAAATLAACALMALAHWVNVGVAALLAPIAVLRSAGDIGRALPVTAAGAALGIALVQLSPYRTPTNLIALAEWSTAWSQLLANSWTPFREGGLPFAGVTIAVVSAAALTRRTAWSVVRRPVAAATATALGYWILIGTSRWVQMNLYYPRYVYPTYILCGVAIGMVGATAIFNRWQAAALTLLAALTTTVAAEYGTPSLERVRSEFDARFGSLTADVVASGARVIGGDYWTVWPAVFHANAAAYAQRRDYPPVYGLTFRSTATDALWKATSVLVAVKIGDRAVDAFAVRTGVSLTFVSHWPAVDLFAAQPAVTGTAGLLQGRALGFLRQDLELKAHGAIPIHIVHQQIP